MSGLNLNPRPPRHGPDPNMQRHVLVITGDTAAERDFEIEHPDCPIVCHWSPYSREMWEKGVRTLGPEKEHTNEGERSCFVQYEVGNIGLDGLDLGDDPPDDGTYVPASQWSIDGWRRLPPGRYIIEPWFHQGRGLMPWGEDESEGGLNLLGPEEPRS